MDSIGMPSWLRIVLAGLVVLVTGTGLFAYRWYYRHDLDHRCRFAQEMGGRLAVKVSATSVRNVSEIGPAMERLADSGTGGLVVLPDGGFTTANSAVTIALAARYRVPAIYSVRFYAASGGLIYGADLTDQFREGATYLDSILRGFDPRNLAVQFATTFDLVINLKTAAALGLTIPNRLLVDAELIE
jgi:putative tryptophan/tyrosine transport system substrate-binding protein